MNPRTQAARARRSTIVRIARSMQRDYGRVHPKDVAAVATSAGVKASYPEVRSVLARAGLHR